MYLSTNTWCQCNYSEAGMLTGCWLPGTQVQLIHKDVSLAHQGAVMLLPLTQQSHSCSFSLRKEIKRSKKLSVQIIRYITIYNSTNGKLKCSTTGGRSKTLEYSNSVGYYAAIKMIIKVWLPLAIMWSEKGRAWSAMFTMISKMWNRSVCAELETEGNMQKKPSFVKV